MKKVNVLQLHNYIINNYYLIDTSLIRNKTVFEQMVLIGEEYVRRELEFIPATCKVIEYYSQSYGCPSCKEGPGDTEKPVIVKSQVPPALLGKGPASASAAAWTMYQKYANGLPLYRQEKDWKQYGCRSAGRPLQTGSSTVQRTIFSQCTITFIGSC